MKDYTRYNFDHELALLPEGTKEFEGTVVLASKKLAHEQLEAIKRSISRNESFNGAYHLDPGKFYQGYTVAALDPKIVAHFYVLDVRLFLSKEQLLDAQDWASVFEIKPFAMDQDDFYTYALFSERYIQASVLSCDHCNLKCIQCPFQSESSEFKFSSIRKKQKKSEVSIELLRKYLGSIKHPVQVKIGGFGEPLMHSRVVDFFKTIDEFGFESALQTNGNLLTKDKADALAKTRLNYIHFSIDSIDSEIYKKIRVGGDFDTLVTNMKYCKKLKGQKLANWELGINFSWLPNYPKSSIEEVDAFFREIVDVIFYRDVFTDPFCGEFEGAAAEEASVLPQHCYDILWGPQLDTHGNVFPCATSANASWFEEFPFIKNLHDAELSEIIAYYKSMLVDPNSELRTSICSKCKFWIHNFGSNKTQNDLYFRTSRFS